MPSIRRSNLGRRIRKQIQTKQTNFRKNAEQREKRNEIE